MKSNRIGLSEYTARRLAELKARRAEADDNGSFLPSSSATATAAAEASVNDSHIAAPSPSTVAQPPPMPAAQAHGSSSADSNSTSTVVPAVQLPFKNELHSSSSSFTTAASHGTSISAPAVAPAVAVSNGTLDESPAKADTTSRHKQLLNESSQNQKPESNPSNEQQRINKRDISNAQAVTEPSKPALAVQCHEIPRSSPYMRSAAHSTSISASAMEVGMLNKMASVCSISQYMFALFFCETFYFAL